jgi:hypothetical protein
MGIGVGIALAALGAILAFAVDASISGLDLAVVGWVLIVAGVLGIVLELVLFAPRRRVAPAPTYVEPAVAARPVVRRDVY